MICFGVLTGADRFPNRFINAGVAEAEYMTALALWFSAEVTGFMLTQLAILRLRCLEQIRNDVCYAMIVMLPLYLLAAAFLMDNWNVSHFATEDLAILRAILTVAVVRHLMHGRHVDWSNKEGNEYHHLNICAVIRVVAIHLLIRHHHAYRENQELLEGTDITFVTIGAFYPW